MWEQPPRLPRRAFRGAFWPAAATIRIMPPRIAIPMPHSTDREYAERAIPQYERAVEQAGGEEVRIPHDQPRTEVMKILEGWAGVLLPGSNADVDPAKFGAT